MWCVSKRTVLTGTFLAPMSARFSVELTGVIRSTFCSTFCCIQSTRALRCLTLPQPARERMYRHAELSIKTLMVTSVPNRNWRHFERKIPSQEPEVAEYVSGCAELKATKPWLPLPEWIRRLFSMIQHAETLLRVPLFAAQRECVGVFFAFHAFFTPTIPNNLSKCFGWGKAMIFSLETMIINSPLRKRQTVTNASEHLSTDFVLKIQSLQQLVVQEVVITNHQDIINMEKHQNICCQEISKGTGRTATLPSWGDQKGTGSKT